MDVTSGSIGWAHIYIIWLKLLGDEKVDPRVSFRNAPDPIQGVMIRGKGREGKGRGRGKGEGEVRCFMGWAQPSLEF